MERGTADKGGPETYERSLSDTMKAWQIPRWGGAELLELVEKPLPVPAKLEVLVRIQATTATYTDQLVIHGNYQPAIPLPATPGYDCVGVVAAVGPGVTSVKVGDRVAAMPYNGCMATHRILKEQQVVPIRDDVSPEQAVSVVLTGVTAYQMLHRVGGGRLKPDSLILVHGCVGGTGAMIVEVAKAAGVPAGNIYGTCSAKNLPAAAAMGITAFDYSTGVWDVRLRAALAERSQTEGQWQGVGPGQGQAAASGQAASQRTGQGKLGLDLVFDAVFLGGYMAKGLSCLRKGGKYIAYGATNSASAGTMPLPTLILTFIRLNLQQKLWSWFDGKEAEFYLIGDRQVAKPDEFAADLRLLVDMVADGRLRPIIGKTWPFEGCRDALLAIQNNVHTGRTVIKVAD